MKIAILGWGSLIWDPKNMEIEKSLGQNGWFDDGPMLPIEFARISNDGRLTLVIMEERNEVQTLYAISKFEELDHAILDLSIREDCRKKRIGFFVKSDGRFHSDFNIRNNIEIWANLKDEIDVIIWTDLSINFKDKIGLDFSEEYVVNYLKYLPIDVKARAEQYVRRAPATIDTAVRRKIEFEFGWTSIGF